MNTEMGFDPLTLQPTGDIQQDLAIYQAEQNEVSGLAQSNPNTTAQTYYSNQNPEVLKAKAEINTPTAGFKPPSNGQMLADMLGGLLLGYGASRLLGADGKASLAIGLNAAGINHDKDLQEVERYKIIESSIEQNGMIYNPQSLYTFMKTGNGSAMEQEEREYFNAGQTATNQAWQDSRLDKTQNYQTQRQQAQFQQQDKNREDNQLFQQGMQKDRLSATGADVSPDGKFTITGNFTKDHEANIPLQDFMSNYRKANADLHKAQQADARIDAVNTNTPIGQVAAAYQFLTVEAPSISNSVSAATGVSSEAVNGWSDKINQILQKGQKKGSFTPQEIDEMKSAAHAETAAMKKLAVDAAASFANGYNMQDLKTATAVSAATGVPASEIIAAQTGKPTGTPVATAPAGSKNGDILYKDGQSFKVWDGKVYPM